VITTNELDGFIKAQTEQPPAPKWTTQQGVTGLRHAAGHVQEEFLTQLQGSRGHQIFSEMANNDPIVRAMLYALENLIKPVRWTVSPYDDSSEAEADAEFIEEVLDDMEHSLSSFIGEWMAAPVYGFAPFEVVYKRRKGWKRDKTKRSKYDDGKLGVSKLLILHPTTIQEWLFRDGDYAVVGLKQKAPPDYKDRVISAEKILLFTVAARKGNPEGTSLLRGAYTAYERKRRIERTEAIGIERELNGIPYVETPPSWWLSGASAEEAAMLEMVKKVVRNVRVDEQAGIVLPALYDTEGNQLLKFKLLTTEGSRAIDTGPPKEYYSRQIAMTILADVILIGHEKVGSFSLASAKTNLFSAGLGALLDDIEDCFNRDLLPKLMLLNGRDPARAPMLAHGDVETPDLEVLGNYITKMAGAGMPLFPTEDGELERHLLRAANLPEQAAEDMAGLYDETGGLAGGRGRAMFGSGGSDEPRGQAGREAETPGGDASGGGDAEPG
jgi:hypothetical protein